MLYALICMATNLSSLALLAASLVTPEHFPSSFWAYMLALFFLFPILYELVYDLFAWLLDKGTHHDDALVRFANTFPIVYHPEYTITVCGIEKLVDVDARKYENVYRQLWREEVIGEHVKLHQPEMPSRAFLLEVMSPFYLIRICYSLFVCIYLEMPLIFFPGFFWRMKVLNPMMRTTKGSVDAASMAMVHKWAINIGGGFHHCSSTNGGGVCIYPDITFVVHYLRKWYDLRRIMIVDLDAHQGNGYERDFVNKEEVFIFDVYNHDIWPGDTYAKQAITEDIAITSSTTDEEYLNEVTPRLRQAVASFKPEFIIYNAGTDLLEGDPLGKLCMSEQGIIDRDEMVFKIAYEENKIPIMMVLSGGFQMKNAPLTARSIKNLVEKFQLMFRAYKEP